MYGCVWFVRGLGVIVCMAVGGVCMVGCHCAWFGVVCVRLCRWHRLHLSGLRFDAFDVNASNLNPKTRTLTDSALDFANKRI